MSGDVCLMRGRMYGRIQHFRRGMMVCLSQLVGVSLVDILSQFTEKKIASNRLTNPAGDLFLKAINTSCGTLDHTPEAAKDAQKCNCLYVTVTSDDLRSF